MKSSSIGTKSLGYYKRAARWNDHKIGKHNQASNRLRNVAMMKNFEKRDHSTLVIIPARGGSKGIPRKNLRPVAGYPLIYYSIKAALGMKSASRVVVSTDDDEIALFAERFGAEVIMRDAVLAEDRTTLDPVIVAAAERTEVIHSEHYDFVVTVQPTSPLVRSADVDEVVRQLVVQKLDTVLTVVDDRHLCWTISDGKPVPAYKERANRQGLPANFRETGAVIACSRPQLSTGTRIGSKVGIHVMPHELSFDIDTFADLYLCEALLSRRRIVFSVVGFSEVGLGHAYRAVMFANELVQYDLVFICEEKSDLAIKYIRSQNYKVVIAEGGRLSELIIEQAPDLVINDVLDTSDSYMKMLNDAGLKCINFEDMGPGHTRAELVINALYPHQIANEKVLVGPEYFCLRDEFLYLDSSRKRYGRSFEKPVKRVLITFGGVDEGDITAKALSEIAPLCIELGLKVEVVVGLGYANLERLNALVSCFPALQCEVILHTKRMSDHMCSADIALTSAGRTVLELASLSVPMIVICQNERETTHTFASSQNGISNLGLYSRLDKGAIEGEFRKLVSDAGARLSMVKKMDALDLRAGKARVVERIKSFLV